MTPKNYLKKIKYYPDLALAIILLVSLQSCASKPKVEMQEKVHPINTVDTIREDFKSNTITADEYYLYMTFTLGKNHEKYQLFSYFTFKHVLGKYTR